MGMLEHIGSPKDLKKIKRDDLPELCSEIRRTIISTVSQNGGHFASNLGVVELTVALHYAFDAPNDSILFDVGHQCYTHKLLTGRKEAFNTLRTENGISGFTRPEESEYDLFVSGHASGSLSSAIGLARAKQLSGDDSKTVAVIGDGSFTGGMVYEAINNIDSSLTNLIVVLNDNKMSISKSVGSVARYLFKLRTGVRYSNLKRGIRGFVEGIPKIGMWLSEAMQRSKSSIRRALYDGTLFEELGFRYIGPVDGHNVKDLCRLFSNARTLEEPTLIHVVTAKGHGYDLAEQNPGAYHGVSHFDLEFGSPDILESDSFSNTFGKKLNGLADRDDKICAVTAAMKYATGLGFFYHDHKERFFDVGIAEQHAVTFCAGLARGGYKPVFAVYSTFLQRAYDQLFHDVRLSGLDVMLAVDRAGIVGDDGETHQGIFDAAFLSAEGFYVASPCNYDELNFWLEKLVNQSGPRAVRYPRGGQDDRLAKYKCTKESFDLVEDDKKKDTLLITYGRIFAEVLDAARDAAGSGVQCGVLKLNVIAPIDERAVELAKAYKRIIFVEEGVADGGIGEQFLLRLARRGYTGEFELAAIEDLIVKQATKDETLSRLGLDAKGIYDRIVRQKH